MALPPISAPLSAPRPPSRVDEARAAFFRQALTQVAAPAAPPLAAPLAPPKPLAQPQVRAPVMAAPPAQMPDRPMRPGSLLDIRV